MVVKKTPILFMESGSSHFHNMYQKGDNNIAKRSKQKTWDFV